MTIRVAINGYGRIGRCILRALYERNLSDKISVVAINDLGSAETNAHLTRFDSTHGRFNFPVSVDGSYLVINNNPILLTAERDPSKLPWKQLDIDVVFECTGHFTSRSAAAAHLAAGAKRVIISAPGGGDVDATVVYGVNHTILSDQFSIISNASCTTNCLAPLAKILHENVGIENGLMNTIHAFTNDQVLVDSHHSDLRRARAATESMIPTKTGAAQAVGLVLPELQGRLDGFAIRVPTLNVSVVDFTFLAAKETTATAINQIATQAAAGSLKHILEINEQPLVSIDFNHQSASCIVDVTQTKVLGRLVKVLAWYDNEWGFSNRMLDVALYWFQK